ncbi:MAG: cytochrome c biogenesis protein ResB [Actinomycetota bacterium]
MSSSSRSRLSVQQSVAMVWRTLRSMRTALILLLLLAAASVVGSLIPQVPNSPERAAQFLDTHPLLGDLYLRAGLFDVFGSWWFTLITVLLFVSLIACLIPRTRATWRALRARPIQAREIDAFRHYGERETALTPDEAIEVARRTLRRRRFRVARDPERAALAAEKGALRETGSLLFHWAFILILVGVVYGKGTGFSGFALVVEGDTWIDAQANYDGQIRTGRFFDGEFTGVGLHLNEFESAFRETGQPMDFVSRVELLDPSGTPIRSQDIRVNHPAKIEGITIYQSSFGWAPVIRVADGGRVIFDDAVPFSRQEAPEGVPQLAMPWRGVVKLPSLRPQVAIDLELWPDSRAFLEQLRTGTPVAMLTSFDPVMRYTVYEGRLTDPSPVSLDVRLMDKTASGIVGAGTRADLATGKLLEDGATPVGPSVTFTDLKQYSVFQVAKDRGVPIVLVAAILILLGLLPALYSSRRKVWVRAVPSEGGARLQVGGFALQRKVQFEEEFDRLVDALAQAPGHGPADAEREKVRTR